VAAGKTGLDLVVKPEDTRLKNEFIELIAILEKEIIED
jgi:hypothetical protein